MKKCAWLLLIFVSLLLCGRGVCGGDEGVIYRWVCSFREQGYSFAALQQMMVADPWLVHHLFWFLLQSGLSLLMDGLALQEGAMRQLVMSYHQVAFFFLALLVGYRYLRCIDARPAFRLLVLASLVFASYGISFLTGGYLEGLLALLIVCRLSTERPATLGLLDALLFAGKMYAVAFTLPLALAQWSEKKGKWGLIYGVTFGLLSLAWLLFKGPGQSGYYQHFMKPDWFYPLTLFYGLTFQLFSFSYGLLWTMPLLILPFLRSLPQRRFFWAKITGLFCLLLIFSCFPFMTGPGGAAGHRYIFPFLLILLPEVALSLKTFPTHRFILICIPLLVLFFSPTLNCRHSLAHPSVGQVWELPAWDPAYHPAVFAWRISLSSNQRDSFEVFPMTIGSRLVWWTAHQKEASALLSVRQPQLQQAIPTLNPLLLWTIQGVQWLVGGIWFFSLLFSCWHLRKSPLRYAPSLL